MNTVTDLRRPSKPTKFSAQKWTQKCLELLGIDGVTVVIVDTPRLTGETTYLGMVEKLAISHTYRLYLAPDTANSTKKEVIAHECIHIKQYHEGRLNVKNRTTIEFEGKRYHPPYDPYSPHEKEAFAGMLKLKREVRKALKDD